MQTSRGHIKKYRCPPTSTQKWEITWERLGNVWSLVRSEIACPWTLQRLWRASRSQVARNHWVQTLICHDSFPWQVTVDYSPPNNFSMAHSSLCTSPWKVLKCSGNASSLIKVGTDNAAGNLKAKLDLPALRWWEVGNEPAARFCILTPLCGQQVSQMTPANPKPLLRSLL